MEYSEWLENRANELRNNPTKSEQALIKYLKKIKVKYEFQVPIICKNGKGYIVDFIILGNVIIEVDGKSHLSSDAVNADKIRTEELTKMGYRVIRMKNTSTFKSNIERVLTDRMAKVGKRADCVRNKIEKHKSKSKPKSTYRHDPDFKQKIYAANGW